MTVEELTKQLQLAFKIESDESSAEHLADLVDQTKRLAKSEDVYDKIEQNAAAIYEKYNMGYTHYAITEMIAKTLLANLTVEQIEYVLNAYTSEVYNKFFSVVGSVLDDYAEDCNKLIDIGMGIKPDKQLLM